MYKLKVLARRGLVFLPPHQHTSRCRHDGNPRTIRFLPRCWNSLCQRSNPRRTTPFDRSSLGSDPTSLQRLLLLRCPIQFLHRSQTRNLPPPRTRHRSSELHRPQQPHHVPHALHDRRRSWKSHTHLWIHPLAVHSCAGWTRLSDGSLGPRHIGILQALCSEQLSQFAVSFHDTVSPRSARQCCCSSLPPKRDPRKLEGVV